MRDYEVSITCSCCGCVHTVMVNRQAYLNWGMGELVQNAMPDLSATEREALVSGLCPECQEYFFGADDDDCDDECGFDPYAGCYTDDC